jgi:hypothetical protein
MAWRGWFLVALGALWLTLFLTLWASFVAGARSDRLFG